MSSRLLVLVENDLETLVFEGLDVFWNWNLVFFIETTTHREMHEKNTNETNDILKVYFC